MCDIYVRSDGKDPPIAIEIKTSKDDDPWKLSQAALNDMKAKGKTSEPLDRDIIAVGIGIMMKQVHVKFDLPSE